ncbi:heterokaryon incompatibility protein-domain-containing protein [Paraphoma chrysanthemicola]|uniref:Heterokaryon incompatibility protein-domain-containing protein n=1 Tax=Paraphoma chrysanthemicola TaxID=798071 RepID=A0A8K0VVN4_9PLEO|nr:heterokaryon incompatibility protein-domain-containing protein [Paraphoma chrysanthemicola]
MEPRKDDTNHTLEPKEDPIFELLTEELAKIRKITMTVNLTEADKNHPNRTRRNSNPSDTITRATGVFDDCTGSDLNHLTASILEGSGNDVIKEQEVLDDVHQRMRAISRVIHVIDSAFIDVMVSSLTFEQIFATPADLHCETVTVPQYVLRILKVPSPHGRLSCYSTEDLLSLIDSEELVQRLCYKIQPLTKINPKTSQLAALHTSPELFSFATFINTSTLLLDVLIFHGFFKSVVNVWRSPYAVKLDHREIRFLRFQSTEKDEEDPFIRCQFAYTLVKFPDESYDVLSYCWGPKAQAQKMIYLNDVPIMVYESLFLALEQLKNSTRPLWIDALCIQQSNLIEKNDQIALMGEIYARATRVIIWLGVDADDSSFTLKFLRDCNASMYAQSRFL